MLQYKGNEMKDIKVSIVIPVYNCEKYINKCLNSLINQTLKEIEIICINDGSNDDSLKILKQFARKDKRIKLISQENKGQSAARNIGLKMAKGQYVGFVDADDYVNDVFYEKLYLAAQKENAQVAVGNINRVEDDKISKILAFNSEKVAENTSDIFKLFNIPKDCYVWNKLYNRAFLIANDLFFKEGMVYEDIVWSTIMASKLKKAISVPQADYYYVYNENSTMSTTEFDEKKGKDLNLAYRFYNKYISTHKIKAPVCWEKEVKVKIFGLTLITIKERTDIKKHYYFCGIKFACVKIRKNF